MAKGAERRLASIGAAVQGSDRYSAQAVGRRLGLRGRDGTM